LVSFTRLRHGTALGNALMILTLTLNTAIDHILHIPALKLGETIRSSKSYLAMGGKGTDASYILGTLGIANIAMGFKAGIFGAKMESMLRARHVIPDFVEVDGETRVSTLIIEDGGGQSTFTTDTLEISSLQIDELIERFDTHLKQVGCVIFGGTPPQGLPQEVFVDLIRRTRVRSIPVVLDASGPALKAGVAAGPTIIKPNLRELEQLTGRELPTFDDILRATRSIMEAHGCSVLATLGEDGALAIVGEKAYRINPLHNEVKNTAGAGDAILAGLAYALDNSYPIEEGLRLGFAAAAAVMMTPQTAECNPQDVERLKSQVELTPIPL